MLIPSFFILDRSVDALICNNSACFASTMPLQVNAFFYRLIMLLAVTIWFYVLLRFLSFGRPHARIAWAGAFFTALLYTAGQLLLHRLLDYEKMVVIYGTSTALALLLLFVFYCSFIFYFGACLTWALGKFCGRPIQPSRRGESIEAEHYEGATLRAFSSSTKDH